MLGCSAVSQPKLWCFCWDGEDGVGAPCISGGCLDWTCGVSRWSSSTNGICNCASIDLKKKKKSVVVSFKKCYFEVVCLLEKKATSSYLFYPTLVIAPFFRLDCRKLEPGFFFFFSSKLHCSFRKKAIIVHTLTLQLSASIAAPQRMQEMFCLL